MMDLKELRKRYDNDPEFYKLVELMENLVLEHQFGFQELREAAFFTTWKIGVENSHHLICCGRESSFKPKIKLTINEG